jgi:hypothetical protein
MIMKFLRRPDLDTSIRINIVLVALFSRCAYGAITRLARKYNVSRTFNLSRDNFYQDSDVILRKTYRKHGIA